jgi:hypothetical protein
VAYNTKKEGADTVSQLYGTCTVSHMTRRWQLTLFYSVLNAPKINAFVIYEANLHNDQITKKIFFMNLALQLMKPYLTQGSMLFHIPVDIKGFLQMYQPYWEVAEQDEPSMKKKSRCEICSRAKNKFTSTKRDRCRIFICKEHSVIGNICQSVHFRSHSE